MPTRWTLGFGDACFQYGQDSCEEDVQGLLQSDLCICLVISPAAIFDPETGERIE